IGLSNLSVRKYTHAYASVRIQWRARTDLEGIVLPPVCFGLLPRKPRPVLPIDRHIGVHMELRAVCDPDDRRKLSRRVTARENVVASFFITVPDDPCAAGSVGGDGGRPIIGGTHADFDRSGPALILERAEKNVGLAVVESLPHGVCFPGPGCGP